MTPEEFDRAVDAVLERLLDQPAEQQKAILDALRPQQPDVCARAESILARRSTASFGDLFRAAVIPVVPVPPVQPQPTATEPLPSIPGYEILGELGRGGMGVVYKARQLELGRVVALKMLLSGKHADAHDLARFRSEAEAIARQQHPNVVQIYEVRDHGGLRFFSMEYCGGGSLERKLRGAPLPPREAAALLEILARAVDAAHATGVVHRDLKPANVLLTEDGVPKISDFGLAKQLDAPHGQTPSSGAIMGTPSYMAPEQALGKSKQVGPAADLHALGAILYQLLTGRPPFLGATHVDTILQVVAVDPVPVRRLQPKVPRDLETICLKCLEKEARRRYASALDLSQDLCRFLEGKPIQARPGGVLGRLRKWTRRHPAVACLLTGLTLAILTIVGVLVWSNSELVQANEAIEKERGSAVRERNNARLQETQAKIESAKANRQKIIAQEQRDEAQKQEKIAKARAEEFRRAFANSRVVLAQAAQQEGDAYRADERLEEVPPDLRFWEWHHLKRTCAGDLFTLFGHTDRVGTVAFSPDGQWLASAGKAIRVWDARTGGEVHVLRGHEAGVSQLVFSPSGRELAAGVADGTVRVWDIQSGSELRRLQVHVREVEAVAYSPDGRWLVSGDILGRVHFWEARTGKWLRTLTGSGLPVKCLAFSASGQTLAVGSGKELLDEQGELVLRQANANWGVSSTKRFRLPVKYVTFSPDSQTLAWGIGSLLYMKGELHVWNMSRGEGPSELLDAGETVTGVTFSPDGQRLISANQNYIRKMGWIKVWDVASKRKLYTVKGRLGEVTCIAISPDGQRLASGNESGLVQLWEARGTGNGAQDLWPLGVSQVPKYMFGGREWLRGLAFSRDGSFLSGGGDDKTLLLWDAKKGGPAIRSQRTQSRVFSVAFQPDSQWRAVGLEDGTIQLVGPRKEDLVQLRGHTGIVDGIAFSPDGTRLFSGGNDNSVRMWDTRTGQQLMVLGKHDKSVTGIALSSEGRLLASASYDRTVKLWNVPAHRELATLQLGDIVTGLALSPNGQILACGLFSGAVEVWDVRTRTRLYSLKAHSISTYPRVAFTPDGERLLTASEGNPIYSGGAKLWDVRTGQELMTLKADGRIKGVFSSDGKRLALVNSDLVELWELRSNSRRLTLAEIPSSAPPNWLRFSADGKHLIAGTDGKEAKYWAWDLQTSQLIPGAKGPPGKGRTALHPQGRFVAYMDRWQIRVEELRPPDESEQLFRQETTRMDPVWQYYQANHAEKKGRLGAVVFHAGNVYRAYPTEESVRAQLHKSLQALANRDPDEPDWQRRLALLELASGQIKAYRQTCIGLLRRFAVPAAASRGTVALAFNPGDAVTTLARTQLSPSGEYRSDLALRTALIHPTGLPEPLRWLSLVDPDDNLLRGMILCRAAKYREAVSLLAPLKGPLPCLFRALAEHGRGNHNVAKKALADGMAGIRQFAPLPGRPLEQIASLPWEHRLEVEALAREIRLAEWPQHRGKRYPLVKEVQAGGFGAKLGIKPGDMFISENGIDFGDIPDFPRFQQLLGRARAEKHGNVEVVIVRAGQTIRYSIPAGQLLGIVIRVPGDE